MPIIVQKKSSGFTLFPSPLSPTTRELEHRYQYSSTSTRSSNTEILPRVSELYPHGGNRSEAWQIHDSATPVASPRIATSSPWRARNGSDTSQSDTLNTTASYDTAPTTPGSDTSKVNVTTMLERRSARYRTWFPGCTSPRVQSRESRLPSRRSISPTRVSRKQSAVRLSRLIDVEDGELDRQRLSAYLGSALDSSFEIPLLTEPVPNCCIQPITPSHEVSDMSKSHKSIVKFKSPYRKGCKCTFGSVICQCSSSRDYKHFTRARNDHKTNTSVSSTACMINVPRARFKTVFLDNEIPMSLEIPNVYSPPSLSYSARSSKDSDSFDWSIPESPGSEQSVFTISQVIHQPRSTTSRHSRRTSNAPDFPRILKQSSISTRTFKTELAPLPEHVDTKLVPRPLSIKNSRSLNNLTGGARKQLDHRRSVETLSKALVEFAGSRRSYIDHEKSTGSQAQCKERRHEQKVEKEISPVRFEDFPVPSTPSIHRRRSSARRSSYSSGRSSQVFTPSHIRQRSNSTSCSSIFEIIESADTAPATIVTSQPAVPVVVIHRKSGPMLTVQRKRTTIRNVSGDHSQPEQSSFLEVPSQSRPQAYSWSHPEAQPNTSTDLQTLPSIPATATAAATPTPASIAVAISGKRESTKKIDYWKRVQQEQDEKLEKVRSQQRNLYGPLKIPARTPNPGSASANKQGIRYAYGYIKNGKVEMDTGRPALAGQRGMGIRRIIPPTESTWAEELCSASFNTDQIDTMDLALTPRLESDLREVETPSSIATSTSTSNSHSTTKTGSSLSQSQSLPPACPTPPPRRPSSPEQYQQYQHQYQQYHTETQEVSEWHYTNRTEIGGDIEVDSNGHARRRQRTRRNSNDSSSSSSRPKTSDGSPVLGRAAKLIIVS